MKSYANTFFIVILFLFIYICCLLILSYLLYCYVHYIVCTTCSCSHTIVILFCSNRNKIWKVEKYFCRLLYCKNVWEYHCDIQCTFLKDRAAVLSYPWSSFWHEHRSEKNEYYTLTKFSWICKPNENSENDRFSVSVK